MKIAVITGASTGIGRAVSIELSKVGFISYLVARKKDLLEETLALIKKSGGQGEIFLADLSSLDGIASLISQIKEKTDHLDLLANIAGVWHGDSELYAGKAFETFETNVILNTFTVGLIAPTLLAHGFISLMESGSKIINLSGTFESGATGWVPYYVSKRGIEDLTIALAQELKDKNIDVNCISPSDTGTEAYARFFPQYMHESIDPLDIAQKFVELSTADITGKIIVMKKNKKPFEAFHY